MLGVPDCCDRFPGIDQLGQGCRIAASVTVLRTAATLAGHGIRLGDRVSLYEGVRLVLGDPAQHPVTGLTLGSDIIVNCYSYLSGEGGLLIGDEVLIGCHVRLLSAGHTLDEGELSIWRNPLTYGRIEIEHGAWIGAGATVLPGVHIGAGAVVGAASVVTRDVPAAAIMAGNPARLIRFRRGFTPLPGGWRQWLRLRFRRS